MIEVPVEMRVRGSGVSSASPISSAWYLIRVVAAVWLQRYRPRPPVVPLTRWEGDRRESGATQARASVRRTGDRGPEVGAA